MPWVPKDTAPPTFYLDQVLQAMAPTQTQWAWIIPYIPLLNLAQWNTAQFCAAGPPDAPSVEEIAGLLLAGRSPLAVGLSVALNHDVLYRAAQTMTFGHLCEETAVMGEDCEAVWTNHVYAYGESEPWGIAVVIPPGTLAYEATMTAQQTGGVPDLHCHLSTATSYVGEVMPSPPGNYNSVGITKRYLLPGGNYDRVQFVSNATGPAAWTIRRCFAQLGEPTEYVPPALDAPPEYQPRPGGTYESIAHLGAELDRQEFKLDAVVAMLQYLVTREVAPGLTQDEEVRIPGVAFTGAVGETDVPPEALGVVVNLTVPEYLGQYGSEIPWVRSLGHLAWGRNGAVYPSEAVKHPTQISRRPAGAATLALDFAPGVSGIYHWVVPVPPEA